MGHRLLPVGTLWFIPDLANPPTCWPIELLCSSGVAAASERVQAPAKGQASVHEE